MSIRQNWSRLVASIFALTLISAFAFAAIGPRSFTSLFVAEATQVEPSTESAAPAPQLLGGPFCATAGPIEVEATAGTTTATAYANLGAAVNAINAGTHQGAIRIEVCANSTETAAIVLNGSGAGTASYTSINMYPVADGLTIAGPTVIGRGLIELNGADNVMIDGDNPNTAGINRNLTIQNTAANTINFTSVIRLAVAATVVNTADNNTVKNLNLLGSATGRNVATATAAAGPENTTFGVFFGPGASTSSATAAPAAIANVATGVATGAVANNLVVANNNVRTAARAISINGAATTNLPGLQITGNSIGNPVAGDPDQVTAIGITAQGSTNAVISGNSVWLEGYVGANTANQAINVGVNTTTAITGAMIEKNKINRVRNNNGQTWNAYGINLGGGNNHIVQNNFVSGAINNQTAGTGAFGSTNGAYGIRVASGTGHKIYHNSVHLSDTIPGTVSTNTTVAFVITSTSSTGLDVRNNIFSNAIAGGNPIGTRNAAVMLPSAATVAMNLTLNNNAYLVGTDPLNRLAQVGTSISSGDYQAADFDPTATTPATNLRAYTSPLSAGGTNDNASFVTTTPAPVPVPFVSSSDLHVLAGTATRIESGGAAVGLVLDIDGESRSATPDMGADEFVGNPVPANDIAPSLIINPVVGSTILTNTVFTPQARFVNNGTAPQTSITVRFRIVNSSLMEVYNQAATISSMAPQQNVAVSFPTTSIVGPGSYTMIATSELAGDSNVVNDTITAGFTAIDPIGGTVNVGAGEAYTSLTNPGGLFQAINIVGITSSVTVNITSDLTIETGAVPLNQIVESGAGGYSLTIKPSGAARTISGTSATNSALIILHGTDRIIFDGSLSGGTDRSLTITNNQANGVVIWMRSPTASNGATNNTIKNCIINGVSGSTFSTIAGVLTGSGVTLGNNAEAPNSNNTIQNNWIYRVQNSLYLRGGATAALFDQNWNVTGNELGSSVLNDKNGFRGMLIGNAANFTISGNTVHGIQSVQGTGVAMSGIHIALLVSNGNVSRNTISDIKNIDTIGIGASGIQVSSTSTASNVTIANNFVTDIATLGNSVPLLNQGHGIAFTGSGTGYNVYFNSVNLNTDQGTPQTTAAMFVNSTFATAGALNVRNNIFANNETTGTRYGVYSLAAPTVFAGIDYNDYFAQNVGFIGGTARPTLADWQTATTLDVNSQSADPVFVSATDLHLQGNSPVLNDGTPIPTVTVDIDNDARSATTPDIGADEFAALVVPGTLAFNSATYTIGENAPTVTLTVVRSVGSSGAVTVDYALAGGTATGGAVCGGSVDYVNTGGTVSFADGETSKTFNVIVCDDAAAEGAESFNATLSNTTGGATIGTPNPAAVTIFDNDSGGGVIVPVGDGQPFTSLTNPGGVFDVINAMTVTSDITITIASDLAGETGTVALNEFAAPFTLTIKPVGAARTITGSSSSGIIKISGADNVTIDGSLTGGTATGVGGDPTLRNLTVQNTSTTATAGAVILVQQGTNGAQNATIKNVNVTGQDPTQTLLGIHVGNTSAGVTPTINNNNSRIENCSIQKADLGIFNNGVTGTPATGTVITRNDMSATGDSRIRRGGIFFFNQNGIQVTENSIGGIETDAPGDAIGIIAGTQNVIANAVTSGDVTNALIAGNRIDGILTTNTVGFSSAGIAIAGGTTGSNRIENNMITGVAGPATAPDIIAGIFVASVPGSSTKVFYNSVAMTGDRGTLPGQSGSYGIAINGADPSVELKGNIFFNTQTSGGGSTAKSYSIGMTSTAFAGLDSNYNDFFSGGANAGFFRTGGLGATALDLPTLAAWQTAVSDDANSQAVNPLFVTDASNLHLQITSPVLNDGTPIAGVTVDFDGDARSATTPDIGADEVVSPPVPGTLAFESATYAIGENAPTVSLTVNRSVGSTGTVTVDYVLAGGTATGGAACGGSVDYVNTGGTLSFADEEVSKTFNVAVCDDAAAESAETFNATLSNPTGGVTIGTPNTAAVTIFDNDTGGGVVLPVGNGEPFTSLTNPGGVFEAINAMTLTSDVTIAIASDLAGETGAVALNEFATPFTLTIKPVGAARTITGSSASGIIKINGADNVTIDGSLTGGTATGVGGDPTLRNLTVQNTSTTALAGAVIVVQQGTNGAQNATIKNVNVSGQDPTQTLLGIHVGGANPGSSPTINNNNSRIENCSIQKATFGIFNNGVTGTPATGTVITRNDMSATGANRLRRNAIFFFNQNGIQVTENSIGGIVSDQAADSIGIIAGIQNVNTMATTTGGVINALISGNRINGIMASSTTGFSAVGIAIAGGAAKNTIRNNMITGVVGPSTSPDLAAGIFVAGVTGSTTKLYYNSIWMTGNRGAIAGQIGSYGIAISGTNPIVELKDNAVSNTQTSGGGADAKSYSIGMASTTFINLDSNYNDFFASGANAGFFRTGSLDTTGTDLGTLAAWQAAVSDDANSQLIDPLFVSTTDLHLQVTSPVLNDGTPVAGITTDFDGEVRSETTPDIGADEIPTATVPGSLQLSSPTYSITEAGGTATMTVTRTGGSDGTVTVQFASSNGTAAGGAACGAAIDYVDANGTLTFLNGETSKTFDVTICNDAVFEGNETVNLALSNATGGGTIGTPSTAVLTITNDDPPPPVFNLSISDVRRVEGNAGTTNAVFNVTLSSIAPPATELGSLTSVQYATANGTATAGSDYTTTSGTLFFNTPGTLTVSVPVVGDLNKEGNEFFFVNLSNATPNTNIVDGQGAGVLVDEDRPYAADFDRDLKADFSVYRPGTSEWFVLQSSNGSNKIGAVGSSGASAVPGDYDGDGMTDFAVFQPSTGNWTILRSSDSAIQNVTWGTTGDKGVQGDYDGDGKTDVAVFRPSNGTWYVIRSSDSSTYGVNFGISTDRPVQGDYDGDFKTDVAVYRDGTWFINRSSTNSVQIVNWGVASDKPVSGDFDGDGRNDLAIYRSGQWWVVNSLSGTTNVVALGLGTDLPAAADYDGDGTTDRVVYRPSSGEWFVLRSSDGALTGVKWGVSTDVPVPSAYLPQ